MITFTIPKLLKFPKKDGQEMYKLWLKEGRHWSPSGLTAAYLANTAQLKNQAYLFSFDPQNGYVIYVA